MKIRWTDDWLDLRGVPEVFVEDPDNPGTYITSKVYIGETDPGVGGSEPYAWVKPSDFSGYARLPLDLQNTTLTGKTATGSFDQWGSEVTTHTGVTGVEVTVSAWLSGYADISPAASNSVPEWRLEISTDGGGSWTSGPISSGALHRTTADAVRIQRCPTAVTTFAASVTPTGDIKVRAMVRDAVAVGSSSVFGSGRITSLVIAG